MAGLHSLTIGEVMEFRRILANAGLDAEMVRKINKDPTIAAAMIESAKAHLSFRLIHGRFTPLKDKIVLVKSWPGIVPEDIDAAVALATENGTISGYETEVTGNPFLDIVITVYRWSVPETLRYARDRMREAHVRYGQWDPAYEWGIDEGRVKLLEGAKPFTPNRIVVEVVDLGANWNRKGDVVGRDVQAAQAAQLAGFAVLYAASQSPEWVRHMDGERVPYALAAALLLNVPDHGVYMPCVYHEDENAELISYRVEGRSHNDAFPVLREYQR